MSTSAVSVIIPAYNCQDTIAETLTALSQQTFNGSLEVIVADDGSSDATAQIVKSYKKVKYLYQENAGPASARNLGASQASGDILLFTDSDCRPLKDWVVRMLEGFDSKETAAVAGSYGIANKESILACVIHEEIMFRHAKLMPAYPKAFGSYNFAIRKDVFRAVGGFNTAYRKASGEDNDLSYKVIKNGHRIHFLKDAKVEHYHQENLPRYLKEQFRHGLWRVRMYLDHPHMAAGDGYTFGKDILEPPFVLFVLFLFLFGFWFVGLIGLFALLAFEMVFAFFMMRSVTEIFPAGVVFFLRAFARTFGFSVGGMIFIKYLLNAKKKT